MRHLGWTNWVATGAAALAMVFSGAAYAADAQPASAPASSQNSPTAPYRAMLDKYCVTCHNQRAKTAGLMFDKMDLAHAGQDGVVWEKAVRKLRGGMMPPPGMRRPDPATVDAFVSWLETTLDQAEAAHPNPGRVALHRLNRAEYTNAVRDILDTNVNAAALLPADDVSGGFDNIAKVLKVSPSFLDQYISAAREVSRLAVGSAPSTMPQRVMLRGAAQAADLPPGARGGIAAEHLFPADGEYEFRVTGGGNILTLDGAPIAQNTRIAVKAGVHKVLATSPVRSFVESDATLESFIPGAAGFTYGGGGGRGGRGAAPGIQVSGPYDPAGAPAESASRERIFVCRPSTQAEEVPCARKIFSAIAHRAFRRPVTSADLDAPVQFFQVARATGDFDSGIQAGLMTILASPKFLYRAEPPPAGLQPGSIYHMNDLELASRLSFFLWSSVPDDELLSAAEQGKLKNPQVLQHEVRRMLADPKSESLVTNFAFEWLKIRDMSTFDPDKIVYPNFDANLKTAFEREIQLFVDSVFREDRSALDLLTANYTFVNERLAMHYGIPNVRGDEFRRVVLPDSRRWGLLGKGAILMVTSYPNRTAPVLRGSYILENITGTPPSPPPPNVTAFKENKEGEKALTVRQIMEEHRANPSCNACHGVMDPLGFALENFDSIGAWRDKDRYAGTQIDSTGKLVDGTPVKGPDDLRKALMSRPDEFVQTMTEKLLTYALGRNLEYYDMPTVRRIVRDAARDRYRFSSIVMGIVNSAPFQMSRAPEGSTPAVVQAAAVR